MALMSVDQLLNQAEDEYMSVDQLVFFKDRLEVKAAELRDRLLSCQVSCEIERHPDEADFASDEENRAVAASMIERDRQTLSHVLKYPLKKPIFFGGEPGWSTCIYWLRLLKKRLFQILLKALEILALGDYGFFRKLVRP
ncbi:TraR/DksA family transcriptional regulator [Pseudomonas meliae]|uniref:TraR/DksA family transcriptional regulator n=1 Tax=Pseudomonas meliae TaxID=86176 RepID=UPI000B30A74D